MEMKPSVIVYGPPRCGKTTNLERLKRHFGLSQSLDFGGRLLNFRPKAFHRVDHLILCEDPSELPGAFLGLPCHAFTDVVFKAELDERVKVRIVVREIERYERVVEMPRALFDLNRARLARASVDVAPGIARLMFDAFVSDEGDDFTELTEVEAFELTDPEAAESLVVFDGGGALAGAAVVGAGLDPDSLEQGDA